MNRISSLGYHRRKFLVLDTVLAATTMTFVVGTLLWAFGKGRRHIFAGDARGPLGGAILGCGAIVMLAQTILTSRKGYVYCGRTSTVRKADDPVMYRIWLVIQLAFSVFMGFAALVLLNIL